MMRHRAATNAWKSLALPFPCRHGATNVATATVRHDIYGRDTCTTIQQMRRTSSDSRSISPSDGFQLITTIADANRWASRALDRVRLHDAESMATAEDSTSTAEEEATSITKEVLIQSQRQRLYVGLACVWSKAQPATVGVDQTLVAIALPDHDPTVVIHVGSLLQDSIRMQPVNEPQSHSEEIRPVFPAQQIQQLLEHESIRVCGLRIGPDIARLRALGLDILARVDLGQLATALRHVDTSNSNDGTSATTPLRGRPNLERLVQYFLQETVTVQSTVDETFVETQPSRFMPFPSHELNNAALLARYHCRLAHTMMQLASNARRDDSSTAWAPAVGTLVSLWNKQAQIVANGTVVLVGGEWGESRQVSATSSLLVNTGKSLVYLSHIFRPLEPPPYADKRVRDWPEGVTLAWLDAHGTTLDKNNFWGHHRIIAVDNHMLTQQYDPMDIFVRSRPRPHSSSP